MNTTSMHMNGSNGQPPQAPTGRTNFVALNADDEINKKACGRIVYWSLNGTVTCARLAAALIEEGSKATPPEEPSALVALHRAVEAVAKGKADVHRKARGEWVIVGKGQVTPKVDADGALVGESVLAYPIQATARINGDGITVEGEGAEQIRAAFDDAKLWLAPADIGAWLCKKVEALGGVALRPSGGFYFIPADRLTAWENMTRAVHAASKHKLYAIPAMRTQEAVDAILSAIAEDTRAACEKIAAEIPTAGERALESRKAETDALLERVGRYEALLGRKLDDIREAVENTKNAAACAMLALGSEG